MRTAVLHAADHHGTGVALLCLVRGMVGDADAIRISVNFSFIVQISSGKGSANFWSTNWENSGQFALAKDQAGGRGSHGVTAVL